MRKQELEGASFHPQINKMSQKLCRKTEDLERWASQQQEKRERLRDQVLHQETKDLRSTPVVGKHSKKIAEKLPRSQTPVRAI